MKATKQFLCWGASGHALVLRDILAEQSWEITVYIDLFLPSDSIGAVPILHTVLEAERWLNGLERPQDISAVVAMGRQGPDRLAALAQLRAWGMEIPLLISKTASVSPKARLGAGCQVLPMAVVASDAKLGEVCIVNHHAVVDHECLLRDSVHIAPGATVCGCACLGNNVFVGAGAVVLPRVHIGDGAMIGAGAVVARDVPPGAVVLGNPAREKRT